MALHASDNVFGLVGGPQCAFVGPTLASAATIAPVSQLTPVSGTTAIDTITVPLTGFQGVIALRPTGVFTWTTNGNIGLAGTAVVGKILYMFYDPVAGKWYPSYVA